MSFKAIIAIIQTSLLTHIYPVLCFGIPSLLSLPSFLTTQSPRRNTNAAQEQVNLSLNPPYPHSQSKHPASAAIRPDTEKLSMQTASRTCYVLLLTGRQRSLTRLTNITTTRRET